MGRTPQEPPFDTAEKSTSVIVTQESDGEGESTKHSISATSWPNALDFIKLKECGKIEKDYDEVCHRHMLDMAQAGLRLTDAELTPMERVDMPHRAEDNIIIQVEKAPVVGVPYPELECVRHMAEFDMDAKTVFDVYVRLNYTDAIDPFTYLVEMLEEVDTRKERFSWAHVAYTADKIVPFFAHRDFVTFDFVDAENLMLVSRSCLHPGRPQTKAPKFYHGLLGMRSKHPKRTIRSPLCYFMRVIRLGDRKCRLVQFQYSDMGGIIPPKEQTKAVMKFGLDNLHRFHGLVRQTQTKGLEVGPNAAKYLSNPLLPGWRQLVSEMIPGL